MEQRTVTIWRLFLTALIMLFTTISFGQRKVLPTDETTQPVQQQQPSKDTTKKPSTRAKRDSGFQHRNPLEDSITISYRYLDSLKINKLDSSLNDFNKYFSVPADYVTLGNNGSAAYPVMFTPILH